MDRGELYRLALSYLGTYDYVPGSAAVNALDSVLSHVLLIAGGYARWRWALKRATLQIIDGSSRLPADFVEMDSCSLENWQIIADELVANSKTEGTAHIVYTSRAWADECLLPSNAPLFNEAVVLLLSAKAAVRVTGNYNLAAGLEDRAMKMFYRARLAEVRQINNERKEESL